MREVMQAVLELFERGERGALATVTRTSGSTPQVLGARLLLRRDGYPPLLWLSGVEAEAPDAGYHFEAYGYNLTFNRRPHLGQTAEYWWHGLTVLCED